MTKQEALTAMKSLRDKINNEADCSAEAEGWEAEVAEALDKASDIIEFPQ